MKGYLGSEARVVHRRFQVWLASIAAAAFALRVLNIWYIHSRLGTAQIHDAAYYHDVALAMLGRLSAPGLVGEIPFANLGYPYVLSWIYAASPSPTSVLVVQSGLGAITAVLIGVTARDVFGRSQIGLWAAGLYALYAPSIFYDGLLLIPSLSAMLSALLAWALARTIRTRSWRWAVLAGVAIGLGAFLRASQLLLIVPAIAAVSRFGVRRRPSDRRSPALALFLATAICIGPVVVRQRIVWGDWIPLTTNGGMNFWIGNHRGASGSYQDAPFLGASKGGDYRHTILLERDRFLAQARRQTNDPALSPTRASGFWWREALAEMARAPGGWLRLMGHKLWFFVSDYESRTNVSLEFMQENLPLLRWNPLRFGGLALLAVVGVMQLSWARHRRASWCFGTVLAVPWITCMVFFVSGEYRHPAAPALSAFAAFGLHRIVRAGKSWRQLRGLIAGPRGAITVLAAALAFTPRERLDAAKDRKAYAEMLAMPNSDGTLPTLERYALARNLLSRHKDTEEDRLLSAEALLLVESNQAIQFRDRDAARRLIVNAKALWQEDLQPNATLNDATIARIRSNSVRRIVQLCRQPFVKLWGDLERELDLLGCHSAEAARLLSSGNRSRQTRPKESNSSTPDALRQAQSLLRDGRHEQAVALLQTLVRDGFYDEALRYALGNLMLATGSVDSAIEFFSAELGRDDKQQTSHYFIALAYAKLGNDAAAIAEFGQALQLDPAHELSQRQWGLLLERRGEPRAALEHLVEATRIHPEYQAALEDAARVAEQLGRSTEAEQWRTRARAANPNTPRRYLYWAQYLHSRGRDAAAFVEISRRLEEAPDDAEALALVRAMRAAPSPSSSFRPMER